MKKFQTRTKIYSSELPLWEITDATIFIPVVIGGEITIGEKYRAVEEAGIKFTDHMVSIFPKPEIVSRYANC